MTYLLHFQANESIFVEASDMDDAECKALDLFKSFGLEVSECVGIIHTNAPVPKGQFVGTTKDGFAYYDNVSL